MSIAEKCIAGGIGCGISGFLTNPMDVVKIRNQQYGGERYGGFFRTFGVIYKEEHGIRGLLKGAKPTVIREMTYSSFRMGMYSVFKCYWFQFFEQYFTLEIRCPEANILVSRFQKISND